MIDPTIIRRQVLIRCFDCYYEIILRGNVIETIYYYPDLQSSRKYTREWKELPKPHQTTIIQAIE